MAKTTKSRAHSVLGGKSKSKGKHPHSIHVRRGKSGGYIAEHHFKAESPDQPTPESEEHVLPDLDALQAHMADNMGDQPDQAPSPSPDAGAGVGPAQPPAGAGGPPPPPPVVPGS